MQIAGRSAGVCVRRYISLRDHTIFTEPPSICATAPNGARPRGRSWMLTGRKEGGGRADVRCCRTDVMRSLARYAPVVTRMLSCRGTFNYQLRAHYATAATAHDVLVIVSCGVCRMRRYPRSSALVQNGDDHVKHGIEYIPALIVDKTRFDPLRALKNTKNSRLFEQ